MYMDARKSNSRITEINGRERNGNINGKQENVFNGREFCRPS